MKIRLTFDFDECDRRAVALAFKVKRPAKRTEVVQWVTGLLTASKAEWLQELRRRELNPDPNQQTLPGIEVDP